LRPAGRTTHRSPDRAELSEHLGKQYIIENVGRRRRPIGSGRAAQAAHDGYTILVMDTGLVINPLIYAKVPYDPFKDFDPIRSPSPPRKCSRSRRRCRSAVFASLSTS